MTLAITTQPLDDLRTLIKRRFADFNRHSSPSRGRKYPAELRDLVKQGAAAGIRQIELIDLTGMSQAAIKYAVDNPKPMVAKKKRGLALAPLRLEVVEPANHLQFQEPRSLVVRLPSGVTIELANAEALTVSLLTILARLEVDHATSR